MSKVKLLLYSTKAKPYLYDKLVITSEKRFSVSDNILCDYFLNGKIYPYMYFLSDRVCNIITMEARNYVW